MHFSVQILGKWELSVHLNATTTEQKTSLMAWELLGAGDQQLTLHPGTSCVHEFEQVPFLKDAF